MYQTKNSVPEKVRIQIAEMLQDHLARSVDINTQAKHAHWNVKGPSFIALHELFDKVAEEAEDYADLIAERIVQYGGMAEGTLRMAAKRTTLTEFPLSAASGKDFVSALAHALAQYGERVRGAVAQCSELGDAETSDIFTEISRSADKYLWFVEAHIQSDK